MNPLARLELTEYERKFIDYIEPVLEEDFEDQEVSVSTLNEDIDELDRQEITYALSGVEDQYEGLDKKGSVPKKWIYSPEDHSFNQAKVYELSMDEVLEYGEESFYNEIIDDLEDNNGSLPVHEVESMFGDYASRNKNFPYMTERIKFLGKLRSEFLDTFDVEQLDDRYILEE